MTNPYLEGNFAPVAVEHTALDLPVTGTIPNDLDGRYLRIGPNPLAAPDPATHHWFLGTGMVHGVRLADGAAQWYRNRYVRSSTVAARLGEPTRRMVREPGYDDFAANTNVISHAGRTLALVEAGGVPYELSDELDTVGQFDFSGTLARGFAAHPHEDPATGELHAIAYNWLRGNRVDHIVVGTDGRVRRSVEVEVGGSPMMHDFALTENYVVIYDLPVVFDTAAALATVPRAIRPFARSSMSRVVGRDPVSDRRIARLARRAPNLDVDSGALPYGWDDTYPARIGLLPREGAGSDVRWFDLDPCFVFHTLNAYEDGGCVVVDVDRHDRTFDRDRRGPSEGVPHLTRFTVDPAAGKVREEQLDDAAEEFPRIDERLTGRRHRCGYAVGFDADASSVVRHDLVAGTSTRRRFGPGADVSEFVFVPRSAASAEDDGVLMGYVYEPTVGRSNLVLLDAATLEDVATVHLPARVPAGFHGNWAPTVS